MSTLIEIRPFHPDDWPILVDLANQAVPFAPQENAEWLEYRKAFDESERVRRHFLAVDGGTRVGYGCLEQQGDTAESLRIYVVASPEKLNGETGNLLYTHLLHEAQTLQAANLWAREFQEDEPIREFFTGHGFTEVERFTLPGQRPMVVFSLNLAV
jgi:N-acetylglutamate synthase-like GNAT family acetyltransferase